jgi:hypothetical protein
MPPAVGATSDAVASGATGAGKPTKLAPPSVVRTIEVQTGLLQTASPRSQYSPADMAVNETGSKPAGTGPPVGCPPVVVVVDVGTAAAVVGTVVATTAVLAGVVVRLLTAELAPDPQPAARTAAPKAAHDKARKRLLFTDLLTLGQQEGFLGHCLPDKGPPPSRRFGNLTASTRHGSRLASLKWLLRAAVGPRRRRGREGVACGARTFSAP